MFNTKFLNQRTQQRAPRLKVLPSVLVAVAIGLSACGGGGSGDDTAPPTTAPPPWGSLALSGSNTALQTFNKVVPNTVPVHVIDPGQPVLQALFWIMDNAYDPRAAATPQPQPRSIDLLVNADIGATGVLVGSVAMSVRVNVDRGQAATVSATLQCGGASASGVFATMRRDPGCDNVVLDATRRTVRFSGVSLPAVNVALDGEISYPSNAPQPTTTATSSALTACPITAGLEPIFAPAWAQAACVAGRYDGTSDTNQACSVVVSTGSTGTPSATVQINGYSATYNFLAGQQGATRSTPVFAGQPPRTQQTWDHYFTPNTITSADINTVNDFMIASHTDLALYAVPGGSVRGVNFTVVHSNAPSGVDGPFDIKTCFVPVR